MNLRENIERIKQLSGLISEIDHTVEFRRRIPYFKNIIEYSFPYTYPCEFENFTDFMQGIYVEVKESIEDGYDPQGKISDWLTFEEANEYIEKFMIDDLKTFYYDNCEDSIIEIQLTENSDNLKDKILKQITNLGLYDFLRFSSMSYSKLWSLIGDDYLTRKIQQNFIQSFINEIGGTSLTEIGNGDVIQYGKTDTEYMELTFLGSIKVIIDTINSKNFDFTGEFQVSYHNLSDDIIEQIFDKLTPLYDEYFIEKKVNEVVLESENLFKEQVIKQGIFDFLKYSNINPYDLFRKIDVKELPHKIIYNFFDDVHDLLSTTWIADYDKPIILKRSDNTVDFIETFGNGLVDINKRIALKSKNSYNDFEEEEWYTLPYELIPDEIFYELFDIILYIYTKEVYNRESNLM